MNNISVRKLFTTLVILISLSTTGYVVKSDSKFIKCQGSSLFDEKALDSALFCSDCNCYNAIEIKNNKDLNELVNNRKKSIKDEMKGLYEVTSKHLISEIVQVAQDFQKMGIDLMAQGDAVKKSCRFDALLDRASCAGKEANEIAKKLVNHFDNLSAPGFKKQETRSCLSDFEVNGIKTSKSDNLDFSKKNSFEILSNFIFNNNFPYQSKILQKKEMTSLFEALEAIEKEDSEGLVEMLLDEVNKNPSLKFLMSSSGTAKSFLEAFQTHGKIDESIVEGLLKDPKGSQGVFDSLAKKCDQLLSHFDAVYCQEPNSLFVGNHKINERLFNYLSVDEEISKLKPFTGSGTSELEDSRLLYCRMEKCQTSEGAKDHLCLADKKISQNKNAWTYKNGIDDLFEKLTNKIPDSVINSKFRVEKAKSEDRARLDSLICPLLMCDSVSDGIDMRKSGGKECSSSREKRRSIPELMKALDCENNSAGICSDPDLLSYLKFYEDNQEVYQTTEKRVERQLAIDRGEDVADEDEGISSGSSFFSSFRGEVGRRVDAGEAIFTKEDIGKPLAPKLAAKQEAKKDAAVSKASIKAGAPSKNGQKTAVRENKVVKAAQVAKTETAQIQEAHGYTQSTHHTTSNTTAFPANHRRGGGSIGKAIRESDARAKRLKKKLIRDTLGSIEGARKALDDANRALDESGDSYDSRSYENERRQKDSLFPAGDGAYSYSDREREASRLNNYGDKAFPNNQFAEARLPDSLNNQGEEGSLESAEGESSSKGGSGSLAGTSGSGGGGRAPASVAAGGAGQVLEVEEPELSELTEEDISKKGIDLSEEFMIKVNIGQEVYEVRVVEVLKDGVPFLEPKVDGLPNEVKKKILKSPIFEKAYLQSEDRVGASELKKKLEQAFN